jgi:hypothetical protein
VTRRDARFLAGCVWCGPAFAVVFGIGFVLAGFLPPPAPSDTAAQIARFFDSDSVRAGTVIMMAGIPLIGVWGCALAALTRRTETGFPVVTCIQVFCAGVVVLTITVFDLIWAVASFRAGHIPPETTRTLNDLAFFLLLFDWSPFCLWVASFAVAIFRDQGPEPVFPRWAAYLNLWVVGLSVPGCLIVFFKHGAFAFDGLFGFYVVVVVFFVWLIAMTCLALTRFAADAATPNTRAVAREPVP